MFGLWVASANESFEDSFFDGIQLRVAAEPQSDKKQGAQAQSISMGSGPSFQRGFLGVHTALTEAIMGQKMKVGSGILMPNPEDWNKADIPGNFRLIHTSTFNR